jgi:hypothetical protein
MYGSFAEGWRLGKNFAEAQNNPELDSSASTGGVGGLMAPIVTGM